MQLFASRAADSDSDFVLDDDSSPAVATICTNVDRLPLAIELTAARTRAFSAQQLAELLDHRFGIVSTSNSGSTATSADDACRRRLELRPAVRRRAAPADATVGVRAAASPWTQRSKVCSDETLTADDIEVLIARLVDKSLVADRAQDRAARPRFRLLRPVADYAAGRLDEAGETATHSRRVTPVAHRSHRRADGRSPRSGPTEWARLANAELPTSLVRPTGDSATVTPLTRCRSESTSAGTPS